VPNRVALTSEVGVFAGQEHVRTTLGVKGSQVQILSSRQEGDRPVDLELLQVSGPFLLSESCRVVDPAVAGVGTTWGPVGPPVVEAGSRWPPDGRSAH
jgi:hypothetical protein